MREIQMRIMALTVVVLGVAVLGNAQTRPMSSGGSLTVGQSLTPRSVRATDMRVVTVNGTQIYQLRGDVLIRIGDADIRADEADLDGTSREVTLRGNVRLQLPLPAADPSAR
jgi:lipopolysaccharide assembly outer membrane protein LptD (OstA)